MIKNYLKKLIPKQLLYFIFDIKNKGKSTEYIFTEIYDKGYWGKAKDGKKYYSGTGTSDAKTNLYVNFLIDFIKESNIKTVFEIGCGDFTIMKKVLDETNSNYVGADVVKKLIVDLKEQNQKETTQFICMDAIKDELPNGELCVIRQVLQHLNNHQISLILEKTKKFKYVIITEHLPLNPIIKNGDKNMGGYIRLQNKKTSGVYLTENPFNLATKTVLSYQSDDIGFEGKIIPAIMRTSLIKN
ncbi:MAG: SAM-dependent methyltransferase [Oligoflexus sp.]|nr:SAM-dependent methyltransferase [Pseudopedobacter sp.]